MWKAKGINRGQWYVHLLYVNKEDKGLDWGSNVVKKLGSTLTKLIMSDRGYQNQFPKQMVHWSKHNIIYWIKLYWVKLNVVSNTSKIG